MLQPVRVAPAPWSNRGPIGIAAPVFYRTGLRRSTPGGEPTLGIPQLPRARPRTGRRQSPNPDPRVHDERSIRARHDRIEVELGDLSMRIHQCADAQDHLLDGGEVGRLRTAVTRQPREQRQGRSISPASSGRGGAPARPRPSRARPRRLRLRRRPRGRTPDRRPRRSATPPRSRPSPGRGTSRGSHQLEPAPRRSPRPRARPPRPRRARSGPRRDHSCGARRPPAP